jgi:uncharacterized protein
MKIGLISDTHIPWVQKDLPSEVMEVFTGVDLILHAGDIYSHVVLDQLEQIAPVLAALGDDDYPGPDVRVRVKQVISTDGFVLWLMHEGPYINKSAQWLPTWLNNRVEVGEKYVKPNIVISGHEHKAFIQRADGVVLINSGSATYLDYKKGLGTVGIINTDSGTADIKLIHLSNINKSQDEHRFIV